MRFLILAVAAAVMFFQATTSFAAPPVKVVNRVPVATARPVKVLGVGGKVQGTLSRVNAASKYMEIETTGGLVRVPANAKLKLQNGPNGSQVDTTFQAVENLARKRVIIIIVRTPDVVVIIIIRTRT